MPGQPESRFRWSIPAATQQEPVQQDPSEVNPEKESLLEGDQTEEHDQELEKLPRFWMIRFCYSCYGDYWVENEDSEDPVGVLQEGKEAPQTRRRQISFKSRLIDSFVVLLFWSSGAYRPRRKRGPFRRWMWDIFQKILTNRPKFEPFEYPKRTLKICEFFDVEFLAQSDSNVKLHARVFRRIDSKTATEPSKLALYFHGGGMTVGDSRIKLIHNVAARIAIKTSFIVVSCDYRLAPEFRFPTQVFDAFDFLRWALGRPIELTHTMGQINFERISLFGDSSGGNLALVLATLVRDSMGPDLQPCRLPVTIDHVVMFYPMMFLEHAIRQLRGRKPIEQPIIPSPVWDFFCEAYVESNSKAEFQRLVQVDRRMSPTLAGLHNLPHLVLVSAGIDSLHMEHLYFMNRLLKSSARLDYHHFADQPHGFVNFGPFLEKQSVVFLDLVAKDFQVYEDAHCASREVQT